MTEQMTLEGFEPAADPESLPDIPERFSTGGGTAAERDEWVAANRPDLLPPAEPETSDVP